MKKIDAKLPLLKFILPVFLLVLGIWLVQRPTELTPESQIARQTQAELLGLKPNVAAEPFEVGESPEKEGELLLSMGDYWAHRVSYPTGIFQQEWLLNAAEQDALIKTELPNGTHNSVTRFQGGSLNLDPTRATSLGPNPLQSDGCQQCFNYGIVAGRANVVIPDPISPTIAYLGTDGGGVWKTENCCSADTVWYSTITETFGTSIAIGDITIDPNDHSVVYAGTGDLRYGSWSFGSAGLLKSTDYGESWEVKGANVFGPVYTYTVPFTPTFPQYQSIGKVLVDPRDSNNVVVTTKTGIFFSFDAAENWTGPCFTNNFNTQRQDGTDLILYDNGAATEIFVAIGTRGQPTAVQPDLVNHGANGIYMATMPTTAQCPAVADWTLLTTGANGWPAGTGDGDPSNDNVGRIDLAMAPSNPNIIYAQVASTILANGMLAIYRTEDRGATWTQRALGTSLINCTGGNGNYTQNWYDQGLAVDPSDPNTVYKLNVDFWRSTDSAGSFTNMTCGYTGGDKVHVDHHDVTFIGNTDNLLNANDGGVYYLPNASAATDYNDFIQMNDTLNTIEFYSGDITANFAYADSPGINGGAQDNGSMVAVWDVGGGETIEAKEWNVTTGGDGMFARIEPKEGNIWFQESQNGNLKRSTTGPFGTYNIVPQPFGGDTLSFIMPYELDKYNCPGTVCNHMIVGTNRVWESINVDTPNVNDINFYPNSPDLSKGVLGNRSFISQLSYAISNGTIAVAGTLDGNVQYGFGLGQGAANSATWVDVTGGNAVLPNRPAMDVVTDPLIPTTAYVGLGGFDENTPSQPGHVYRVVCNSDCSSFTWTDKSGNLPNIPVNSIAVNPNIASQVFAGTDWGVYFTDDINAANPTWARLPGVPSAMIWDFAVDRGFSTLAIFTRSRGAYVWPLPTVPDFRVSVTPTDQSVCVPASAVYDIDIAQLSGFNQPVDLSANGVPSGYTANFGMTPITPPAQTTVSLDNTGAATSGSYLVDIIGSTLTRTITASVALNLVADVSSAVTLTMPADGATNVPFGVAFAWGEGDFGTESYILEVAEDDLFSTLVYSVTIPGTDHTMPNNILMDMTTYYWRVQATNICGLGAASEVRSFTTVDLTGSCPAGTTANIAYQSDFESGEAGWTHEGVINNVDTWVLSTANASSGVTSWYVQDWSSRSDQRLTSPAITLGNAPVLRFENIQRFEVPNNDGRCWDAGILEISTDSGATWNYVDNSHMLSDQYDNVIWADTANNNPLEADYGVIEAWCQPDAPGFFPALVDLSDWAGETVHLRWRMATDNFAGNEGWYIDDVRVQSCVDFVPEYSVNVTAGVQAINSTVGTDVTYHVTVTNTGNVTDSFTIDVESTWDATVSTTDTGDLGVGESTMVTVTVSVPYGVAAGAMDMATVTATSNTSNTATGSVELNTTALWLNNYLPLGVKDTVPQ